MGGLGQPTRSEESQEQLMIMPNHSLIVVLFWPSVPDRRDLQLILKETSRLYMGPEAAGRVLACSVHTMFLIRLSHFQRRP